MKRTSLHFLAPAFLVLAPLFTGAVYAQTVLNEHRVQPEVWSMPGPVEPGVGATGDLSLSIPIMTVPGRGLNYDISLGYSSSIALQQDASWIGLGWNFDPGSITREVEGGGLRYADPTGFDLHSYGLDAWDRTDVPKAQPDFFYITLPGKGTFEMTQSNTSFSPGTIPAYSSGSYVVNDHRAWSISTTTSNPVQVTSSGVTWKTGEMSQNDISFTTKSDIQQFVVTTEDGTRYVFGQPTLSYYDRREDGTPTTKLRQMYVSTWRLIAILGADFTTAIPSVVGTNWPNDTHTGSWIRFEYTPVYTGSTSSDFSSTTVYQAKTIIQTQYLSAIVTPTHRAAFTLAGRDSPLAEDDWQRISGLNQRLQSVGLYSRLTSPESLVRKTDLVHANTLSTGALGPKAEWNMTIGRLALEGIRFFGRNGAERPGYTFGYTNNPTQTLTYYRGNNCIDDFGYLDTDADVNNACSDATGTLDGTAWSLTNITYPTGATEEIIYQEDRITRYEQVPFKYYEEDSGQGTVDATTTSDSYNAEFTQGGVLYDYRTRQGGARVREIRRTDGMGSANSTHSVIYKYPDGRLTGVPPGFWKEATPGGAGIDRLYFPGNRGKALVMYEWVEQTFSDSASIWTHYTVPDNGGTYAFTGSCGSGCADLAIVRGNQHWNGQHVYKVEYFSRNTSGTPVLVRRVAKTLNSQPIGTLGWAWGNTGTRAAEPDVPIYFGAMRPESETVTEWSMDGTASTAYRTNYTYDARTNLLQTTEQRFNKAGSSNHFWKITETTFAHDQYTTTLRPKNMLSQAAAAHTSEAQCASCSTSPGSAAKTYHAASVTTWRAAPGFSFLKPWRALTWTAATPSATKPNFTDWTTTAIPSGWMQTGISEQYDAHGNLIKQQDGNGNLTEFFYGANGAGRLCGGAVTSCTSSHTGLKNAFLTGVRSGGLDIEMEYDAVLGQVSEFYDENNDDVTYVYDDFGRLLQVKNAAEDLVTSYTYDDTFTLASPISVRTTAYKTSDTDKTVTTAYFDGLAREIQTQVENGSSDIVAATEYDARGRRWRSWKPSTLSAGGFVATGTATADAQAEYGNANAFTETRYYTDPLSRIKQVVQPGATHSVYTYHEIDGTRTLVRAVDEEGITARQFSDALGNVVRTEAGSGLAATEQDFTATGAMTQVRPPNYFAPPTGSAGDWVRAYTYDTAGRLTQKATPDAGAVQYKYDDAGNLRYSQDARQAAEGTVLFMQYDALSRPTYTGEGEASFSALGGGGAPAAFEGIQGNWKVVNHYDDDALSGYPWNEHSLTHGPLANTGGRLAATAVRAAPASVLVLDDGSIVGVTETYTSSGQIEAGPFTVTGTGDVTFTAGQKIVLKPGFEAQAGSSFHAKIDAAIQTPDAKEWQLTFYSYDDNGRVAAKYVYTPGLSSRVTLTYAYDRQGNVTSRTAQVGSQTFYHWYDYDQRGLLWRVYASTSSSKPGTPELTYTYTPTGQVKTVAYRNGPSLPYTYTLRDQVAFIGDIEAGTLFGAKYEYLGNGNIWRSTYRNAKTYSGAGAPTPKYSYTYTYDDLSRLTAASYAEEASVPANKYREQGVTYDRNGNILTLERYDKGGALRDNLAYSYAAGTNRLASIADAVSTTGETWDAEDGSYSYDANGNVTSMPAPHSLAEIDYDYRNLPVRMHRTDGMDVFLRYDASGQRIYKQTTGGVKEHYVVDGMETVAVLDSAGAVEHWNLLAGGVMGRWMPGGGGWRYYVKDHLGSVRQQLNDQGSILSTGAVDYYPFGLQMPGRNTADEGLQERYTGHELDVETGLYYAGARYLDPVIGRWNGVDPMADKFLAWSPYNYAMNNPLRLIDPTGLAPAMTGGCPPNCPGMESIRYAFSWAESGFNTAVQATEKTSQAVGDFASGIAETVVKQGPEFFDGITYAASATAVAAGGAALVTGGSVPTPDDALHATVAAVAAGVATASNTAATVLSAVDAAYYGGDVQEATIRGYTQGLGVAVGGVAGGVISGAMNRAFFSQTQRIGTATAVGTAAGSAASEAATHMLEEEEQEMIP